VTSTHVRRRSAARAQALGQAEPQGFSDLAHGSTGTGHRHLSWNVDAIPGERDGSGAPHAGAADDLTRGWPLPVKQGGHFRRNGVSISRETGWPKPVKSALW